jgi:hypothetical protein
LGVSAGGVVRARRVVATRKTRAKYLDEFDWREMVGAARVPPRRWRSPPGRVPDDPRRPARGRKRQRRAAADSRPGGAARGR